MKTIAWTAKLLLTEGEVTMTNAATTKQTNRQSTLTAIHHTTQSVGGSEEALSVGDVDISLASGAEYVIHLWNRDTGTGYVEVLALTAVGVYTHVALMRAGEPYMCRRAKNVHADYGGLYLKGSTAGPRAVEVIVSSAGDPDA